MRHELLPHVPNVVALGSPEAICERELVKFIAARWKNIYRKRSRQRMPEHFVVGTGAEETSILVPPLGRDLAAV